VTPTEETTMITRNDNPIPPRPTRYDVEDAIRNAIFGVDETPLRNAYTAELRDALVAAGIDVGPALARELGLAAARAVARTSIVYADVAAETLEEIL